MIAISLEHGNPERTDVDVLTLFAVEDAESLTLLKKNLKWQTLKLLNQNSVLLRDLIQEGMRQKK